MTPPQIARLKSPTTKNRLGRIVRRGQRNLTVLRDPQSRTNPTEQDAEVTRTKKRKKNVRFPIRL